ncbi:MAG TPA: hypothetical protein VF633_06465 [Brevundimonas sp.]|jgi:hypothetical protein
MQNILIGLGVLLLLGVIVAMALNPGRTRRAHFTDADSDGESDETPEQKRRALRDRRP